MTVNINAANISSVQLAAAQTPSAPNTGFVRLHHNANSRLAMRPATGNVVEFLGNTSGSGAGITFPATQSPSSDANTLDDYEEGTWTPSYTTDGNPFGSITYTANRTGVYTKVGRLVTASFVIETSSITLGSASGSVLLSGFSFLVGTTLFQTGAISYVIGFADDRPSAILARPGTNSAYLYYRDTADGNSNNLVPADLGLGVSSNLIYGVLMYVV